MNKNFLENSILINFVNVIKLFIKNDRIAALLPFKENILNEEESTIFYTPFVGALFGIIAFLISTLIMGILGDNISMIVIPFLLIGGIEFLDHGLRTKQLIELINAKLLIPLGANSTYGSVSVFIIKLFVIAILVNSGHLVWLIPYFVLSFTFRGIFLNNANEQSFYEYKNMGITAGIVIIICLILAGVCLPSVILAILIMALVLVKQISLRLNISNDEKSACLDLVLLLIEII